MSKLDPPPSPNRPGNVGYALAALALWILVFLSLTHPGPPPHPAYALARQGCVN